MKIFILLVTLILNPFNLKAVETQNGGYAKGSNNGDELYLRDLSHGSIGCNIISVEKFLKSVPEWNKLLQRAEQLKLKKERTGKTELLKKITKISHICLTDVFFKEIPENKIENYLFKNNENYKQISASIYEDRNSKQIFWILINKKLFYRYNELDRLKIFLTNIIPQSNKIMLEASFIRNLVETNDLRVLGESFSNNIRDWGNKTYAYEIPWFEDFTYYSNLCEFISPKKFFEDSNFAFIFNKINSANRLLGKSIEAQVKDISFVCMSDGKLPKLSENTELTSYTKDDIQIAVRIQSNYVKDAIFIDKNAYENQLFNEHKPYLILHEVLQGLIPEDTDNRKMYLETFVSEIEKNIDSLNFTFLDKLMSLANFDTNYIENSILEEIKANNVELIKKLISSNSLFINFEKIYVSALKLKDKILHNYLEEVLKDRKIDLSLPALVSDFQQSIEQDECKINGEDQIHYAIDALKKDENIFNSHDLLDALIKGNCLTNIKQLEPSIKIMDQKKLQKLLLKHVKLKNYSSVAFMLKEMNIRLSKDYIVETLYSYDYRYLLCDDFYSLALFYLIQNNSVGKSKIAARNELLFYIIKYRPSDLIYNVTRYENSDNYSFGGIDLIINLDSLVMLYDNKFMYDLFLRNNMVDLNKKSSISSTDAVGLRNIFAVHIEKHTTLREYAIKRGWL